MVLAVSSAAEARRRRFIKVRTADDKEGWVDGYALLTTQQMDDLRTLAERAQQLPSQGMASVYDVLNMHTEPSRQSPSFYQIPEKGQVDIIGHRVAPRGRTATVPAVAVSIKAAEQPVSPARKKRLARAAAARRRVSASVSASPLPQLGEGELDEQLGLGARDQHAPVDGEVDRAEGRAAEQVLDRLVAGGAVFYPWPATGLPEGMAIGTEEVLVRMITAFDTPAAEVEAAIALAGGNKPMP